MVVAAAEGDEVLLAIAGVAVALGVGVGFPFLLKAVLAQHCVMPKVKKAAKVAARSEARLALVEGGGDGALVKGEEEGEAARAAADARDGD